MAGQSIDIPAGGSMFLDNNLTNDGTITMDASAPSGYSYLYLEGYTLTNPATFDVPADSDNDGYYAIVTNSGSIVNTGTVDVDGDLYVERQRDVHERHRRLGGGGDDGIVRRRVRHFHE